MKHHVRTLPILVALALLTSLGLRARAAGLQATRVVYLPLVACPSCSGGRTPATPTPSQDAAEVIRLVNSERAKLGCPAVVAEAKLLAATQAWAEYMAANNLYQHTTADWYAPYGYPTGVLENIGPSSSPTLIVDAWMTSPFGHRENLLVCYPPGDPSYDPRRVYRAGVGHAGTYWVWGLVDVLP
jgi:uncharacterized protein YkwD